MVNKTYGVVLDSDDVEKMKKLSDNLSGVLREIMKDKLKDHYSSINMYTEVDKEVEEVMKLRDLELKELKLKQKIDETNDIDEKYKLNQELKSIRSHLHKEWELRAQKALELSQKRAFSKLTDYTNKVQKKGKNEVEKSE